MPDYEDSSHPATWADKPHVVLVVDESGSMGASRETTISAINDYLGGLKTELPAESLVTIVKFNTGYPTYSSRSQPHVNLTLNPPRSMSKTRLERLVDRAPLSTVAPLTQTDYVPTGGTPLYDALGSAIGDVDADLIAAPAPVYLAVITDGEENASVEYKLETIKTLLDERSARGWTFTFLGVDIDAYRDGATMGFSAANTVSLSRATLKSGVDAAMRGASAKFAEAKTMAASGDVFGSYASWSTNHATFSVDDKAELERKT